MREQFYHHCFVQESIGSGEAFPIGGSTIGSTEHPYSVIADADGISAKVSQAANPYREALLKDENREFLDSVYPGIPTETAATLQAFTGVFENKRNVQAQEKDPFKRIRFYDSHPTNSPTLSAVFAENNGKCAEICVLAKRYLDDHGIKSKLFSGEFMHQLSNDGDDTPEGHTFLLLDIQGQEYVYDPTHPIPTLNPNVPAASLLKPEVSFASLHDRMKNDATFIACKSITTGRIAYYGVGDLGNVLSRDIFGKPNPDCLS